MKFKLLASFKRGAVTSTFFCAYKVNESAQAVDEFAIKEGENSQGSEKIKTIMGDTSNQPVYTILHNMHESLRWTVSQPAVPFTLQGGVSIDNSPYPARGYDMQSLDGKVLASFSNFHICKNRNLVTFSHFESSNLDLWSARGEHIATLDKHTDTIWDVLCLDNSNILSYSCDKTLRLWSYKGEQVALFEGHDDGVRGAKILPDGKIISFSNDWTIRIWSADGKPLRVMKEHKSVVSDVLILNDGRIVSYAYSISNVYRKKYSHDGRVLIWSSDGELVKTIPAFDHHIDGVTILSDNRILVFSDTSLSLFDNYGNPIAALPYAHEHNICSAIELDNGNIVTLGVRGFGASDMKVWKLS